MCQIASCFNNYIFFVLLLLASIFVNDVVSANTAVTPLQVILNSVAEGSINVDGFQGVQLSNIWDSTCCTSFSCSCSSGWSSPDTPLQATFANAKFTDQKVIVNVGAELFDNKSISLNVSISFQGSLSLEVAGNTVSTNVLGLISKVVSDIPISAIGSYPVAWSGWLQSTSSSSSLFVNDANLFDGVPAVLMTNAQSSSSPPNLSNLVNMVADPAKRFGVLNSVPSTYFGDTVRDKFLNGSWLSVDQSVSGSLLLFSKSSQPSVSARGTYVTMSGSCASCGFQMSTSLTKFVDGAMDGHCQSLSIVGPSLSSNTSIDFFVTGSSVVIRSFSVLTQAVFRCNQGSSATFIGLSLSSSQVFSEDQWPLQPFMTDANAAVGMLQNMPLQAQGFVWGSVLDGNKVYTLGRSDIFSAHGGGALLVDQLIGKGGNDTKAAVEQIQGLFDSICDLLGSDIKPLNNTISTLFPTSGVEKLLHDYQTVAPIPSIAGFFQWFVAGTDGQVDIHLSSGQVVLVLNVSTSVTFQQKHSSSAFNYDTVSYRHINASFSQLINQVFEKYPGIYNNTVPVLDDSAITGWQSVWLTSSIIIKYPVGNNTFDLTLGTSDLSEVTVFTAEFKAKSFFSRDPMFSSVSVTYEHGLVDLQATLAKSLQHKIGTNVGISTDNVMVLTSSPGPNSASIALSFQNIAANLSTISTENANAYINYDITSLCGSVTWGQAMTGCSKLDFGDKPSPFDFRDAVAHYIDDVCQGTDTTVVVTLQAPRDSSYVISIVISSVQDMSLNSVGNPWEQIADTSRLVVPLGLRTCVQLSIGNTSVLGFDVEGSNTLTGWTLPFSYNMLLGSTTGLTSMTITLDLPDILTISASIPVYSAFDEEAMGSIYVKMDAATQEVQVTVNTDTRLQVPSTFVVSNIVDGLFQLLPNAMDTSGPADISVGSAFQTNFASQNTFEDYISTITPWLTVASDISPVLIQSSAFCAGSAPLASFTLSISVNKMNAVSCVVTPTNDTSAMDVAINSAFAKCGLQSSITAAMLDWEDDCGIVGLYPAYPGLVWSVNINTESTLFASPTYQRTTIPAFGSWQDLVHILAACSLEVGAPVVSMIPSTAAPDLLPQQLVSVYPSEFPAVTFPLTIKHHDSGIVMPLSSEVSAENIQLQTQNSNLTLTGDLVTTLRSGVVFLSGLPPMGGGVNISVITSFTTPNQTMQFLVPEAPNNTFVIIIKGEMRSTDLHVTPITVQQTITLTPGTPSLTALAQALAEQLPPIAQPLIDVSYYPALFPNLPSSCDQIRISVSRYLLNNGSWVIPFSLTISDPLYPALSNATIAPVTIMMLTEDLTMLAATNLNSENVATVAMAGTLGILDVHFGQVVGGGSIQIATPTLNKYHSILSLGSAIASQFYNQFSIDFNVSMKLQAQDLSVQYADQVPAGSSVPFALKGGYSLKSASDASTMFKDLENWAVNLTKPFLAAAQKMEDKVICNWATLLEKKILQVINFPTLSTKPLPFVSASMGVAFQNGLGTAVSNMKTQICQSPQTITLSTMCTIMQNSLGFNPCGDLHLGAHIMLDLNIVGFKYSHVTSFELDTHSIFGGNLPLALGLSDSISFNTYADLDVKLDIDLNIGGEPNVTLGPEATAVFGVGFSLTGSVVASLGPLQLSFGGIEMLLGGANYASTPAILTAKFTEDGVNVNIVGSATMGAQTLLLGVPLCQFSIKVPSIAGYLRNPKGSGMEVDYPNCNGGFVQQIVEAIEKNTLLAFFSQPLMLIRAIEQAISQFLSVVFGMHGIVGDVELPLVGKLVELIVATEISAIVGPKALGALVSNIADVTSTLQHVQTLNQTYIDQLVLEGITKAICAAFVSSGLMTKGNCPAVPHVGGDVFAWPIHLGRSANRQTDLFTFHLGGHGFASLNSQCTQQLNMGWQFDFILQYSRQQGISVQFPQPIFQSDISMKLANCLMSGKIGFMAADFFPTGGIQGKFEVATFQQATLDFNAELGGEADFGFTTNTQELTMFPYWQVGINFRWAWSLSNRQMAPIFTVSQGKVCAGHYLTKVLTEVLNKAQVIIKPMEKILGPNSLLLKPIPVVKYIIGHQLTYLDFCVMIVKTFCSSCYVTGVEAVEIFMRVVNTLNDLQALVDNQCDSYNQLKDFALDFTQPLADNIIQSSQPDPPVALNFVPNTPAAQNAGNFQQHWQNFNGGDPKYGVNFDIMKDPVRKLLDMILGVNVPLISVNIPPLSIYIHVSWQFLIYPPIWLTVGFSTGVKVDVGQIAFTSAALTRTLESGSPGNLFNSVAIPANQQVFDAYGRLSGGICVSFFIKGCASVFIQIEAQVNTLNPDNNGWVTFDEIFWLHHHNGQNDDAAYVFDLTLSAGIEISLKICIHLIFKKKCWNIYHHSWSAVIYRYQYGPKSYVPSINSDGSFDMGTALLPPYSTLYLSSPETLEKLGSALIDQAQYRIYSTPDGCRSIDIFPPGIDPSNGNIAPYTRCTDPSIPVYTYGSPGGAAFSMDIQGVTAAVNIPPSPLVSVTVSASSYDAGSFAITPQSVTPPGATGIFVPQCNNIHLYDAPIGTGFTLSGIQCPITIDSTPLSDITISGSQGDYGGRLVTIANDAYNVVLNVPANQFTLTDTALLADSGINVAIPSTTSNILVLGSTLNSQFDVQTVSPSTTLTITGGSTSVFNIAQIGKLYGRLILNGGAQISELNALVVSVNAADGPSVSCTQTTFVQSGGATESLITYSNIGYRNITYYGAPGVHLINTIVTPEPAATINIWSIGVADGLTTHQVTGCGAGGMLQVDLSGGGTQSVIVGQNGDLSAVQCTILVHGSLSSSQTVTLNIDATTDTRNLQFTYRIGSLLVSNPAKPADFFNVQFSNVAQVVVNHGDGNSVIMGAVTQNYPTEYQFIFPDAPTTPCSVTIDALPNAIVIKGSATVSYTAQPGSNTPFDNVAGMVAVVGGAMNQPGVTVKVTAATGTVPNSYGLDSSCLNILDANHAVVPPSNTPSAWMCGLLQQYGFNDGCKKCQVKYLGNTAMSITTSNGDDYFYSSSPKAQVSLATLGGDDTVYWEQGDQAPPANLDVGAGTDQLTIIAPCNTVTASLGADHDTDALDLYMGTLTGVSPTLNGNVVSPIGTSASDQLVINQYYEEDLLSINNNMPPSLSRPLGLEAVQLRTTVPGQRIQYNMQSSTTYQVVGLAAGSALVLQGTNSDDPNNPSAQNWQVEVLLPSFSTDAYLNIWAAKGSNGILTVTVPSDGVVYSMYVTNSDAEDLGFVTVGGLRIQISNGAHLLINSPQTVNVVVDDTPTSMDLVISATLSSLVTLQMTTSPVFLLNTAANIQPAVLGGSNVVYFYGGSMNIDGSQVSQVNFADGMVSVFKQTNSAISTWFAQQLTAANVPSNPLPASVVVGILKCNNISVNSAFVSATGTGMFVPSTTTYFEALVNAQLLLTDNTAWVNSKIVGSVLTVDSRYKLTMVGYLSQTATLVFDSASHTNFVIQCDTPATYLTNWWLHNDTTSRNYTWEGTACNGYISLNIPTPAIQFVGQVSNVNLALMSYVPVTPAVTIQFTGQVSNVNIALLYNMSSLTPSVDLQFAGPGLTNMNLALLGNVSARSVTVTGRSLDVDSQEATLSLITDDTHQLMINTVVAQSVNNIFVNYATSSQSSGTFGPDSCSTAQLGSATVLVSDFTNQLKLCVATTNDGSLAVYDNVTWSQASVENSMLIVDQRYHLLLVDWHNTLFYTQPTAATLLTVLCGVPLLSNQFTMWKLAGDTPGVVSWTGASCGGTINTNAYPKLFFAGSGNPITATIQLPSSSVPVQRTTSINNSTVSLTTSEVPPLVITTDTASQLLVLFDFTTQTNATSTVQMDYPAVPNGVINTNVPSTCSSPYTTSSQSIFGITSTSDNTVYCFAVAGDVVLSDPQQWTHTTVQGGNLNVADRYLFSLLGGPNTVLGGKIATYPVVSGSTLLEISCGSYIISNQSVQWNILSSNASVTSLAWNSQSCNGAINVNTSPLVLFSGPGQTSATLTVDDSAETRSIVLQDSQVTVSSTAFTQIETSDHPLYITLALRGGVNNVVSNYSQSASIASVTQYRGVCASNTATAKVLLSNSADTITQCITVNGNGNMVLQDPYDWQNVSIASSVLTIPGRYQLELLTYSGLVLEPLVSSQTALTITCGQCSNNGCPVTGAVWWNVGGSDAQQFSWNSTYCGGALVTDVYPVIQFTGAGLTNVKTNFTVATSAYNTVVMNAQSLNISASADNSSLLTMSTDSQHQLSVVTLLSENSKLQLLQTTGNSNIDSSEALGICRGFSLSSTVFVSTGLTNMLQLCLVTKLLSVVDTLPWTNINLVADVLTVPSRYQLNLVGTDVTFFPLISSTTLLQIICGQATVNQVAAWNIQNYSPATVYPTSNLTSTAASCTLAIGGIVLPQLLFSGSGSTVANLNLLADNVAQRSFNFSAGYFQVTSDNTQWPILVTTDTTHDLQVMLNANQGQNTLILGYTESQTTMDTPAILGPCTTASPSSSAGPSVAVSNAGDNSTYCLISTQGTIIVSDYATLPHAIITGFTWHVPQRYRVDLINWDNVFINPPVTSDTMIEVQCGIPSDLQITPYWHMGMNQISNVTWQGTACQGVITNLFPTYNFTGEGSTEIFADLMSSSPEDVVVRQITAGPNSLRVNILPDVANISIYSTHPISVALSLIGGANSLLSTYPVSSNNVSFANSSNCIADDSSTAAIFFSNMIDNNTYCMVAHDGLVFVEDMEQWAETEIHSSTLSVPFRYNVELLKWEGVYFLAFTNDSVVNIYCNEPNVTSGLTWRIGTNTTAGASEEIEGPIVWNSASCNGVATNLFPQLIFRENGTSNITLLVDETFVPASISLNTLSLFTTAPYAYIATDGVQIINMDMLIEAQGTEIILDRTPVNEFVPRLEAEDPVKISSVRESSVTLSGKLKFNVDTSSIESNPVDSSVTSCLAPHLECQSADFVDMKILGASPCITKTHFSDCLTESVLFINTNYSLTCSAPSDTTQWSLSVVSSPQETHYSDAWLFYVVIAVFGYGVFCFVVGLCVGPALINAGVLEVAILASLRHVRNLLSPYWNLKIRILVMSGYEVAYNLFTGWFCAEDGRIPFFGEILHVIPVYVAISLSGLVILLISFVLMTRIPVWDRIREKRVPAWLDNHLHWFIHVINVVVALATWLVPFAISHATLQKPYAYEILLSILLIPLIIGLARCIHFKIAPLSMFIPLIVLPALSRDDVPTPWLVIFSLAAASIILNTVSATLRRLPLCSSIPDKRPAQIQAIDNRLYPHKRFNVWLFSFIIPLRAFGDLVGLGFLFTMLFFPHFFTVILWLIWAGISMLAGTMELLPAVVASLRRNKEEPEVIQHSRYVPVSQDPSFEEDPDLAYPRYGTNALVDDYSADNTHNNDGNESDASSEIFEDPNTSYSLNK